MSERSFREIKDAAEQMTTASVRYPPSVRQPTPDAAKLKAHETDKNTEKVVEHVATSSFDQSPKANLVMAVEVEVRRDREFRERIQRVMDDATYMEQHQPNPEPKPDEPSPDT